MTVDRTDAAAQHLASIVDTSDDAIISKDLNGIVMSWNAAAERIFGYAAREVIGQSIRLIIPPERSAEEDETLRRLRAGETISHYETVRVRKDGSRVEISLTVSPMRNADGVIVGASKIARDISERRRLESELARNRSRARRSPATAAGAGRRIGIAHWRSRRGVRALGHDAARP